MRYKTCAFAALVALLAGCGDGSGAIGVDSGADNDADVGTESDTDPYPNVARVQVPDSFQDQGDGTYSLATGTALFDVTAAFYEDHPDDYDMLIVWTDFPLNDIWAFSLITDHSIQGIGQQEQLELWGEEPMTPDMAGSAGRLQLATLMSSRHLYEPEPTWGPQDILTHEIGHRWSANLPLTWLPDPWVLTDLWAAHWNIYAAVGGPSAEGYGQLVDDGGGSFHFEQATDLAYSTVELYQQGLIPPEEVGPLYRVLDASGFDPATCFGQPIDEHTYSCEVSYQGTREDFTIDDVIAAIGPRVPAYGAAQTEFRMAFILVCVDPASCSAEGLAFTEEQRVAWEDTFAVANGGRATADTSL